jgi:hypothetical protein
LEQDEKPFSLEIDYFSKLIEDKLGSLLKEFDVIDGTKDAILFNKDKKKAVAKQIVLQYMRTPKYRDIKYHNETQAYLEHICILLEKMGFYAEELSYYSDKREYHRRRLCDESEINEIVDELIDAHWDLWYTDKEEFYTSDNPVVIIERQDMPVTYCDAIKYFDDIYFPLNSNLLLHIVAGQPVCNKYISIQTIEQDKVNEINRIIKNKAPHYILYKNRYCCSCCLPVQVHITATASHNCPYRYILSNVFPDCFFRFQNTRHLQIPARKLKYTHLFPL